MHPSICRSARVAILAAGILALGAPAALADGPKLGWADTAEFSYVATSGNTKTQTLGFRDKLTRTWERSLFTLNAGGIRVESTTTDRFAVGTTSSFGVTENERSDVTAENYYLNARYDHKITDHFFWFGGAGWDRNTFSGIQNRYTAFGGVGNIWADSDTFKWRTDYGATFTKQDEVVSDPTTKDSFAGARLSSSLFRKLGASTSYTNDLVLDENLDDTKDLRGTMINALSVSMTKRLAIKVSLQWLYDNRPSFKDIDLFDAKPPLGAKTGVVPFELDRLDTIFTTSVVVNF